MERIFTVYSQVDCPYCKKAIALLKSRGEEFTVVMLDYSPTIRKTLSEIYHWKTVPMIVVAPFDEGVSDVKFIGGCEDLERFLKEEDDAQEEESTEDDDPHSTHGNGD